MATLRGIVNPHPEKAELKIQPSYDRHARESVYLVEYAVSGRLIFNETYRSGGQLGDWSGLGIGEIFAAGPRLASGGPFLRGGPELATDRYPSLSVTEQWVQVSVTPTLDRENPRIISAWHFTAELLDPGGLLWKTFSFRISSTEEEAIEFGETLQNEFVEAILGPKRQGLGT